MGLLEMKEHAGHPRWRNESAAHRKTNQAPDRLGVTTLTGGRVRAVDGIEVGLPLLPCDSLQIRGLIAVIVGSRHSFRRCRIGFRSTRTAPSRGVRDGVVESQPAIRAQAGQAASDAEVNQDGTTGDAYAEHGRWS